MGRVVTCFGKRIENRIEPQAVCGVGCMFRALVNQRWMIEAACGENCM